MSHMPRERPLENGDQVREVLFAAVRTELEVCATIADEMGDRLTRSGKGEQASVAQELAAKIRARKPT